MNTRLRLGTVTRSLLAILFVAQGIAACTTQEATLPGTGGNTAGGNASGGATAKGGSTASTGGSTAPTGGSAATDGVLCEKPAQALITDFTYTTSDAGAANTSAVHFGNSTTLQGSHSVYPGEGKPYPLVSDVTKNNWHISGTIGDYSGFLLHFDNCSRVDASKYKGISLKISGSVPLGDIVTMGIDTLNNNITAAWLRSKGHDVEETAPGRCVPTSGTNKYSQSTCSNNTKAIPVTATPTEIKILWEDFTGGKPDAKLISTDIIAIYWYFPPPAGVSTATPTTYVADLVIDDLSFIP